MVPWLGGESLGTGPHVDLLPPCPAHHLPGNPAHPHCHLPSHRREKTLRSEMNSVSAHTRQWLAKAANFGHIK